MLPISDRCRGSTRGSWWGIGAPRGTPGETIGKLSNKINAGLADQKLRSRFVEMGALVLGGSPGAFAKMIVSETENGAGREVFWGD